MFHRKRISFLIGFLILFFIYHFPEFFSAFWIMATFKIGFLVAAFFLAVAQGWQGFNRYGLGLKPRWRIHLITGLLLGFVFFALSFFISVRMEYEKITAFASITAIAQQLPLILLMTAIPSLAEDILTRGYLYTPFGKSMKPLFWVLFSSGIYVLNHIWRLDDGPAVLSYLFIFGMVLAYAVWIVNSLWLAFGIHWGANIAFESIQAFIQTKAVATDATSTWILASVWGALLVLLLITMPAKKDRSIAVSQAN